MKQLLYFRTCVEEGSISTAAEKLYTTQPNVSKVISTLETQIGEKLLHRNARGVFPTTEGKQVYKYARTILMNEEYLEAMTKKFRHYSFSVASMPSRFLAYDMSRYYNDHSDDNVDYQFWEGDVNEVLERVENHHSEIGFVYIHEHQLSSFLYLLKRRRMEYVEIKKGETAVFLGKNHPLYGETEIPLETLQDMNFLKNNEGIYGIDSELEEAVYHNRQKLSNNVSVTTNSDYVTQMMLLNTDFVHLSFKMEGWDGRQRGLWEIPIPQLGFVTFGYVKRVDEPITKELLDFLEYLEGEHDNIIPYDDSNI